MAVQRWPHSRDLGHWFLHDVNRSRELSSAEVNSLRNKSKREQQTTMVTGYVIKGINKANENNKRPWILDVQPHVSTVKALVPVNLPVRNKDCCEHAEGRVAQMKKRLHSSWKACWASHRDERMDTGSRRTQGTD